MPVRSLSAAEADTVILDWVQSGIKVCFAIAFGDACSVQRVGTLKAMAPGVFAHNCSETFAGFSTVKYGEIIFVDEEGYRSLRLRKPHGVESVDIEVMLIVSERTVSDGDPISFPLVSRMIQ